VTHLVARLVVGPYEAEPSEHDLDVPDVPAREVSKTLRGDLRAAAGAARRDVHGGEQQQPEVGALLQELVTAGRVDPHLRRPRLDEAAVAEGGLVDQHPQHHVSKLREAVRGNVREEKVDVVPVALVDEQVGDGGPKPGIRGRESERDGAFPLLDVLQKPSKHVSDPVQPHRDPVHDRRAVVFPGQGDLRLTRLVLRHHLQQVPVVVQRAEGIIRLEEHIFPVVLEHAGVLSVTGARR
jgi:hypothetical protein